MSTNDEGDNMLSQEIIISATGGPLFPCDKSYQIILMAYFHREFYFKCKRDVNSALHVGLNFVYKKYNV